MDFNPGEISFAESSPLSRSSWSIRDAVHAPRSLLWVGRSAVPAEALAEAVVLHDADSGVGHVPSTSADLADVLPEITGLGRTGIPGSGDGRRPERDGPHGSQRQQADDFPFHGTSC